MIKLIIKQGPFYISSFTALFLALAQTGWLDRMFPPEMQEISEEFEAAEELFLFDGGGVSGGDFFDPPATDVFSEWWVVLTFFVVAGIILGYVASKLWTRFVG